MVLPLWIEPVVLAINLILLPYLGLILVAAVTALISRRVDRTPAAPGTRFLVVIPAHDEEPGISATIRSCLAIAYPRDLFEVLVIADNCSDETASVARGDGATVVERNDPAKKSKGHAIQYLIDWLQESGRLARLDALVVIDADTTVDPNLLQAFAGSMEAGADWIQCFYSVANPDTSWRTRLMAYAFSLFNGVTPLGQSLLGLSGVPGKRHVLFHPRSGACALPELRAGRGYGILVERADRRRKDRLPARRPSPRGHAGAGGQGGRLACKRWEFGRRELSRRMVMPLVRSRHLNLIEKIASLIELTMPPMVLLLVYYLAVTAVNLAILIGTTHAGWLSAFLIGSSLLMTLAFIVHALCPFVVYHLSWSYALTLLYLPVYAIWKLPAMFGKRPTQWVRTAREEPVKH